MKQKILLFGLFFILFQSTSLAGSIEGVVKENNKPQEFVLVRILGQNFGDRTDVNGRYKIIDIPKGTYKLEASGFGLLADTITVQVGNEVVEVNFNLKKDDNELEEVTVTGTMREVSVSDSPVAIDIIQPKLFERNPSPGLFQSIGMVNGVRPQLQCNVCNTGDIHINGMEGPYTMVMIDGMPIVSALGSVYGLMGIPNSIIQRVEVQKGPSSTLYGSEAVGGLINVITRSPDCGAKYTFDVRGTSYGEYNVDAAAMYKVSKKLSGIFSTSYFNFNKIWDVNHDGFTDVTLQNRIALFNKFAYRHDNGNTSHLAVRYFYEDRWGGQTNWNTSYRGGDEVYGESIYTNRFELIGKSKLGKKGVDLWYSFNRHLQNSAYGNTLFLAEQNIGFVQFTKHIDWKRHGFLFGAAYRYTFYDDNTVITQTDDELNPNNMPTITNLPGLFLQDEIKVNEKNTLLLGLRYDYNSIHGGITSPRANWKYELNPNHIFRASIGNGYRVVNLFSEDHAAYTGARKVVIEGDLKPEQSWNASMNYNGKKKFKSGGHITFDANLFYTYFSNKIVADYFQDANQVVFANLDGYGINRGGGLQVNWKTTKSLKFLVGVTYTDLFLLEKDSIGQEYKRRQVQTPPLTANIAVGYSFEKIRLNIDLTGNIYSPMLLPVLPNDYRPDHSPWFALMNIQVLKKIKAGWEVYGGVKNFLNYLPKYDPIIRAFDPFDKYVDDPVNNPYGYTFDPGYNYAPYQQARAFLGVRLRM